MVRVEVEGGGRRRERDRRRHHFMTSKDWISVQETDSRSVQILVRGRRRTLQTHGPRNDFLALRSKKQEDKNSSIDPPGSTMRYINLQ